MTTYPLFASYVSTLTVNEDTSQLKYHNESWKGTGGDGTSLGSVNLRVLEKYPKIKKILLDKFLKIAKEEYEYVDDFAITTSWFTKTEKGEASGLHLHKNSFYSGIYYFDEYSSQSAPIRFESPIFTLTDFYVKPKNWQIKNRHNWRIYPEKNLLILFPSYLKHTIMKSEDDAPRYSLAFNIIPLGVYGDGDSQHILT